MCLACRALQVGPVKRRFTTRTCNVIELLTRYSKNYCLGVAAWDEPAEQDLMESSPPVASQGQHPCALARGSRSATCFKYGACPQCCSMLTQGNSLESQWWDVRNLKSMTATLENGVAFTSNLFGEVFQIFRNLCLARCALCARICVGAYCMGTRPEADACTLESSIGSIGSKTMFRAHMGRWQAMKAQCRAQCCRVS